MIDRFQGQYAFLSNTYPCLIIFESTAYLSAEHLFQAVKAIDQKQREQIAAAHSALAAKRMGRQVALRPGWDQYWRYVMMETALSLKFSSGSQLGGALLETGTKALVEGNTWHDQVWGDCRCGRPSCAVDGMNLLGWMLMRRRSQLKEM